MSNGKLSKHPDDLTTCRTFFQNENGAASGLVAIGLYRFRIVRTDATLLAISYLAFFAHFMNDYCTAKHHMDGLCRIVQARGGLLTFTYNPKLILELLK